MKRPLGISIISILNFLFGLYLIVIGLGASGAGWYSYFGRPGSSGDEKSGFLGLGLLGVITFVFGLISIIAAVALWKLKSWAWYLAFFIILWHLGHAIYVGAQAIFTQEIIIHCVVYGLFALYFLTVKKYFGTAKS